MICYRTLIEPDSELGKDIFTRLARADGEPMVPVVCYKGIMQMECVAGCVRVRAALPVCGDGANVPRSFPLQAPHRQETLKATLDHWLLAGFRSLELEAINDPFSDTRLITINMQPDE